MRKSANKHSNQHLFVVARACVIQCLRENSGTRVPVRTGNPCHSIARTPPKDWPSPWFPRCGPGPVLDRFGPRFTCPLFGPRSNPVRSVVSRCASVSDRSSPRSTCPLIQSSVKASPVLDRFIALTSGRSHAQPCVRPCVGSRPFHSSSRVQHAFSATYLSSLYFLGALSNFFRVDFREN